MSEEIKQKDKLKDGFEDLVINDTGKNFDDDMFIIQDWWLKQFDSLLSQALQKRDEETLAKVKSLVMGYDTKDGYTQLYDQVIEHVYDQLLSNLTTK